MQRQLQKDPHQRVHMKSHQVADQQAVVAQEQSRRLCPPAAGHVPRTVERASRDVDARDHADVVGAAQHGPIAERQLVAAARCQH